MNWKPFIPQLRHSPSGGFSLIELLVSMFIASIMLTVMTGFFRNTVAIRDNMNLQTETQQGLRALFEMISQELRQAGACLPKTGQFITLAGSDGGDQDSLTLRIGQTNPGTLVCVKAGTSADASGSATLPLTDGDGDLFDGVALVYVTPDGATGDFYQIVSGTGVYAVDERIYTVDTSGESPMLTVSIDGGSAYPLVGGVEKFGVQYLLGPCDGSGCADTVDEPADSDEWELVRELVISATVRSSKEDREEEYSRESGEIIVKPRNLL
jgi:prepilin-type N-terminal cleavage/methylation domain-containing protein